MHPPPIYLIISYLNNINTQATRPDAFRLPFCCAQKQPLNIKPLNLKKMNRKRKLLLFTLLLTALMMPWAANSQTPQYVENLDSYSLYSIKIENNEILGSMACPTRTSSNYSITQQIYTCGELQNMPCIIWSIDFWNNNSSITRNLDIYMVHTDKVAFESGYDWVEVTAADLLFSGDVTFAQYAWTTIMFQSGFEYNGQSNVVLVVDDNTGSGENVRSFAAMTTINNTSRAMALKTRKTARIGISSPRPLT